jgi:FAD/FMN-containing dehydrogenase
VYQAKEDNTKYVTKEWKNWSGDVRFKPAIVETPVDEKNVQQVVIKAIEEKRSIRAVGSSHSCAAIFKTDDILLSTERLKGLISFDIKALQATLQAGTTYEEAGNALLNAGLAVENIGYIDKQAIGGAISTGTHGAGKKLANLSSQMTGVRLVTGLGEIKEFNEIEHPEMLQALRVSLGSMGIFTRVTLKVLPSFIIHRREYCLGTDDCINHLDQLMEENRNFNFYWYPRRDDVKIILCNFPQGGSSHQLPFAKLQKEYSGWGKDVIPSPQELRFNEMEYALDLSAAVACFQEIRKRVKQKHRPYVGWRILFRPVARDSSFISNAFERDIIAITLHQNASLPFKEYFDDIEPVFKDYGGRPHWAKKHSLKAADLKSLYPEWDRFHEIRKQLDPHGIFLNAYLKRVFLNASE